jgi:modulator of drug activity B
MKKILVINGGQVFPPSEGRLNRTIAEWTVDFFKDKGYEIKLTDIKEEYDPQQEVEKLVWADLIVYHTPIWWYYLPHDLKKYMDIVFNMGHQNGMYFSDGRRSADPKRNYGRGGLMQATKYMLTTTWNAPEEAFTMEGEFFEQRSVDDGVMYGFHKVNEFLGMSRVESFHFYDVFKNPDIEDFRQRYLKHLEKIVNQL